MRWRLKRRPAVPPVIRENIQSIHQLEAEVARQRSTIDRISDAISAFSGSFLFIFAHVLFIGGWILVNTRFVLDSRAFDPYPYVFLNLVLAIEAVLLGTFVLMSQNRQNRQADQRAHLDLQIGLLSEREATKTLELLREICNHLGLKELAQDKELQEMIQVTRVQVLAEELQKVREPEAHPPP